MSISFEKIREDGLKKIDEAKDVDILQDIRRELTGKKSVISDMLKKLKYLSPEDRKSFGKKTNDLKMLFFEKIEEKKNELINNTSSVSSDFDISLPGNLIKQGTLHPITQMQYDLNDAFRSLGFEIFKEDDISSEKFAFDNLNFPPDHPARATMDTYWIDGTENKRGTERLCLRPHLTGASVRYLLKMVLLLDLYILEEYIEMKQLMPDMKEHFFNMKPLLLIRILAFQVENS